jgi:hypothetical protein
MIAAARRRPRLAAFAVTLAFGSPYAALLTSWFGLMFIVPSWWRAFGLFESIVLVAACLAAASCGRWLRAAPAARLRRAITTALLCVLAAWAGTLIASGLWARVARGLAQGVPLVSLDLVAFVTEGYRIGWTLWVAGATTLLIIGFGSLMTLFTPWLLAVLTGYATWRLLAADQAARRAASSSTASIPEP